MTALLKTHIPTLSLPAPTDTSSSLALLAELHAEAVATTHFGKLLPRSLAMAASLACLTGFILADSLGHLAANLVWAALVLGGAAAILCCYSRAVAVPVGQENLERYARTLAPVSLYCGIAWGLGAFLVLPAETGLADAAIFVGAPVVAVALCLRERALLLAFALPMLTLSSFGALLRPLPDAPLAAALMLLTGAATVIPFILMIAWRRHAAHRDQPRLPNFAS